MVNTTIDNRTTLVDHFESCLLDVLHGEDPETRKAYSAWMILKEALAQENSRPAALVAVSEPVDVPQDGVSNVLPLLTPMTVGRPGPSTRLDEVQNYVQDHLEQGLNCPACGGHAKMYPRALTKSLVTRLARLHAKHGLGWFDLAATRDWKSRDEAMMQYWGLLQYTHHKPGQSEGSKDGWWRVTPIGRDFLSAVITLPRVAHVYNGQVHYYSGQNIAVTDVIKNFSINELLVAAS